MDTPSSVSFQTSRRSSRGDYGGFSFQSGCHSERGGHAETCHGHAFLCVRSKRGGHVPFQAMLDATVFGRSVGVEPPARTTKDIQLNETDVLGELVGDCDGFAGVHPEHKFKIVQVLKNGE